MNVISISERNKRIQDEAARDLIKKHVIAGLGSLQEALEVAYRYKINDMACIETIVDVFNLYSQPQDWTGEYDGVVKRIPAHEVEVNE